MKDPLEQILQQTGINNSYFEPSSRYFGIPTSVTTNEAGEQVAFVRRRFIAPKKDFHLLQEHTVSQSERVDNLTHKYLGDPEQFWRVCDANAVMHPNELTAKVGRIVRITLPAGVPGNESNA